MRWHVIHTKPRQELRALLNLERQGYECYLPMISTETMRLGVMTVVQEPLFPRYLFIHLDNGISGKGWGPIRSTKGVGCLVTFGAEPAGIEDGIIEALRRQGKIAVDQPRKLFNPGERLMITKGAFAGLEGVYQMADGEQRAMVLIDFMSKFTQIRVSKSGLKKIA